MAKRQYYLTVRCTENGCTECCHYHYDTRRDYSEAVERHKGYKCLRHKTPERVLSLENLKTEEVLVNSKSEITTGLFWSKDGITKSGFQSGNGYAVWSKDFPEGTILKVTAEIILP